MKSICFTLILTAAGLPVFAQWTPVDNFPNGITNGCTAAIIGDTAYVTDGTAGAKLWAFSLTTNHWYPKGTIGGNKRRAFGFTFAINNKLYIGCGDTTGTRQMCSDMWMYDPANGQWTKKASFGGGVRDGSFCFVLNNKAYVGGGEDGNLVYDDFWSYDPATNAWTSLGTVPFDNLMFPASFVSNNKGYVTCWQHSTPPAVVEIKSLWEFDPAGSGTWTRKDDFPGAARQAALSFATNNYGYVGGGQAQYDTVFSDMWRYSPAFNSWQRVANLPLTATAWSTAFASGSAAYLGTGAIFLPTGLGGTDKFYKYAVPAGAAQVAADNSFLNAYPNPASGTLCLQLRQPQDVSEITISDVYGKVVLQPELTRNITVIDVRGISKGIYFVRGKYDRGTFCQKIEIQ
jgi:N-acetylneuraminic acid mutarotase